MSRACWQRGLSQEAGSCPQHSATTVDRHQAYAPFRVYAPIPVGRRGSDFGGVVDLPRLHGRLVSGMVSQVTFCFASSGYIPNASRSDPHPRSADSAGCEGVGTSLRVRSRAPRPRKPELGESGICGGLGRTWPLTLKAADLLGNVLSQHCRQRRRPQLEFLLPLALETAILRPWPVGGFLESSPESARARLAARAGGLRSRRSGRNAPARARSRLLSLLGKGREPQRAPFPDAVRVSGPGFPANLGSSTGSGIACKRHGGISQGYGSGRNNDPVRGPLRGILACSSAEQDCRGDLARIGS